MWSCCESQEQLSNSNGKTAPEYHILEDSDYWEPPDDVNELYRQLCLKKYREITPQQLEYVSILLSMYKSVAFLPRNVWERGEQKERVHIWVMEELL